MRPLAIDHGSRRYDALIGVGGIGAGTFFALGGDHTLGREESRGGRFLDRQDYCKLHIVCHYVATLLGPSFAALPIGRVGDDEVGRRLLGEMREAGLDVRRVTLCPGEQTLFSFCFVYPDGSGGNLTTDDSACSKVDASLIRRAESDFLRFGERGIALAVPEVPLAARAELLKLGAEHRLFRVASFTSGEMTAAAESGLLAEVDLLAANVDEAAAVARLDPRTSPPIVVEAAVAELARLNPRLLVSVTAGRRGSWAWDGSSLSHVDALSVEARGTAGAGDAHLAGIVVGLTAGLSLPEAEQLGTLVAALAVTSPHTINRDVDRDSLRRLAEATRAPLAEGVRRLLGS